MKAVAMMTPLPKNLAIRKTLSGILKAGIRLEKIGKVEPVSS
jgi:hypothetical protein